MGQSNENKGVAKQAKVRARGRQGRRQAKKGSTVYNAAVLEARSQHPGSQDICAKSDTGATRRETRPADRPKKRMAKRSYRILNVVGARPNLMKIAPLIAEMRRFDDLTPILVHTGQHYDYTMSGVFFDQLRLPEPDYELEVGSGTHHYQTAEILHRFGKLVAEIKPDLILVVGDVNSTMGCALVAAKEHIPLAHVEAGLRSFDRTMPEEVNRVVTDALADLLFTTEESASVNLQREGVAGEKIFFTGNVMIDSLADALQLARRCDSTDRLGLTPGHYGVLTLHRPSNVDCIDRLHTVLGAVAEVARDMPVIFPVHPRTEAKINSAGATVLKQWDGRSRITESGVWKMPPAPYLDFVRWMDRASLVITDSGGIQDETTYLGVPCLTFRENTERQVTVTHGTNHIVGTDPRRLVQEAIAVLRRNGNSRKGAAEGRMPPLWDGRASQRIVRILRSVLRGRPVEVSA
jgi:UDP-N-acetylglucosamine 2-epimerase (non-hydrolysing)